MIEPSSIIKRVLVTEKAVSGNASGKYTLEVVPSANKVQIAQAIEVAFKDVEVGSVNIVRTPVKRQRIFTRRGGYSLRNGTKKAIVTLKKGKIEMN